MTICSGWGADATAGLLPVNGIMALSADAYEPFLRAFERDIGLPSEIAEPIRVCRNPAVY